MMKYIFLLLLPIGLFAQNSDKVVDFKAIPDGWILMKKDGQVVGAIDLEDLVNRLTTLEEKAGVVIVDNTSDKQRIEALIKGKSSTEIFRMFNKTTATKNGYSMLQICEILALNNKGTKRTLATRISLYAATLNGQEL